MKIISRYFFSDSFSPVIFSGILWAALLLLPDGKAALL